MCLPFNHEWKEHWKAYHTYQTVGVYGLIMPTKKVFLGRHCKKCGKWKPSFVGASPPRRGRVKRQTRAFKPMTDAEKARQDAARNVWGNSYYMGSLSSFGVGDNYLNPIRSRSMPSDNPWLTPPTGGG